jgi:hypothetical protein
LFLVGTSMIQGFNVVNEWITPQTAPRKPLGVDTWKLGSNGARVGSAYQGVG